MKKIQSVLLALICAAAIFSWSAAVLAEGQPDAVLTVTPGGVVSVGTPLEFSVAVDIEDVESYDYQVLLNNAVVFEKHGSIKSHFSFTPSKAGTLRASVCVHTEAESFDYSFPSVVVNNTFIKISANNNQKELMITRSLVLTAKSADGDPVIQWKISDPKKAALQKSENGSARITAQKTGSVTITATTKSGAKGSYQLTVYKPQKALALTFDDGPHKQNTQRVINALKANDAAATFFVLGQNAKAYPSLVQSAYNAGCEIGNHSYSHPNLTRLSYNGIVSEITKTDQIIVNITGKKPRAVRPPYGSHNSSVRRAIGDRYMALWTVDTLDWKYRNANRVVNYVMAHARNGSVILLHDIHATTAAAAEKIIPRLRGKGFELVTYSEMMAIKNYK